MNKKTEKEIEKLDYELLLAETIKNHFNSLDLERKNRIAIMGFLIAFFFMFSWCLDISVSALVNHGYLTNGILTSNPTLMYHIALYGQIIIFMILFLFWVKET